MGHMISITKTHTIVIFTPSIQLFKPYKMITEHAEKYTALENFEGPYYQKSMGKPLLEKVWVI